MSTGTSQGLPSLVLSDLDGTFLTRDKTIPAINMAALDLLAKNNIPFVPCTGRGAAGVVPEILNHAATSYVISANGAVVQAVHHLSEGTQLGEREHVVELPKRFAHEVFELCRDRLVSFDVFCDGRMVMERRYVELLQSMPLNPREHKLLRELREQLDISSTQIIDEANEIERVSVFWCYEQDRDAIVSYVEAHEQLTQAAGAVHIIEITNRNATKGEALRWLTQHLGIDISKSLAFGDATNDIDMIRCAGTGVAMANSRRELLEFADVITPLTNDEGAPGHYITALFENGV